jgi:ABC-type branched-subunit amino acid transport system substrate-binding protein
MSSFKVVRIAGALSLFALVAVTSSSASNASTTKQSSSRVPIAIITSLTGEYAAYGLPFEQGATFAVHQIDQSGFKVKGKTYKFSLYTANDNTTPATAVQEASGLIDSHHIVAMFGPIGDDGPPVEEITNHSKVIMFSSASAVAATAGAPGNPYVFITNGNPGTAGTFSVDAIKGLLPGAQSIAFLDPADATDATLVPLFQAAAQKDGLQFFNFSYPVGTTDLTSILTNLVADKPSVIVETSQYSQEESPQLTGGGVPTTTPLFLYSGNISNCQTEAAGRPCIADPLVGVDLSSSSLSATSQTWIKDFEAYTHTTSLSPYVQATTWTYDFPFMLEQAMQKAGSVTNTTAIEKALHKVTRNGLIGTISFNAHNGSEFGLDFTLVSPTGQETTKRFS